MCLIAIFIYCFYDCTNLWFLVCLSVCVLVAVSVFLSTLVTLGDRDDVSFSWNLVGKQNDVAQTNHDTAHCNVIFTMTLNVMMVGWVFARFKFHFITRTHTHTHTVWSLFTFKKSYHVISWFLVIKFSS